MPTYTAQRLNICRERKQMRETLYGVCPASLKNNAGVAFCFVRVQCNVLYAIFIETFSRCNVHRKGMQFGKIPVTPML